MVRRDGGHQSRALVVSAPLWHARRQWPGPDQSTLRQSRLSILTLMPLTAADVFPPDALDANRRGELTDVQRHRLGNLARDRRKSQLRFAGIPLVLAVLVGGFGSSSVSIVSRGLVTLVCLGIAAVLVVRSVTGADSLTRDLRDTRVESAEGAIGKRRHYSGVNATNYFLDV